MATRKERQAHMRNATGEGHSSTTVRGSGSAELSRGAACKRVAAVAGHHGPRLTGSRRCGQSGQGTTEPWPGRDGLDRPMRGSARARGAPKHGDAEFPHEVTARTGTASPSHTTCTNFKALITTKPLLLNLNRLHYTQDGIWNYQIES